MYFLLSNDTEPYESVLNPVCRFVSDWMYSGFFRDVYKEFMIQVNEDYLSYRGEACTFPFKQALPFKPQQTHTSSCEAQTLIDLNFIIRPEHVSLSVPL